MSKILKSYNINMKNNVNSIDKKQNIDNYTSKVPKQDQKKDYDENHDKDKFLNKYKENAKSIIEDAKLQAEKILKEARLSSQKEEENFKKLKKEEGYQEGYQKGLQEIETLRKDTEILKESILENIEKELVDLIISIVDKLLNKLTKLDESIVINLIRQGLDEASLSDNIVIKICDEDYEYVNSNKEDLLKYVDNNINLKIIKDTSLEKFACIIETPFGNIDCSLDQKFKFLQQNLYLLS